MIKVYFSNFWENAFKQDFLFWFISQAFDSEFCFVDSAGHADIIFSSVFGKERVPAEKTVFFTGENIRPNYALCSYSLSFDLDDYNGRNFYLPLWYFGIQWPGFQNCRIPNLKFAHGFEPLIPALPLIKARESKEDSFKSKRFCCLIASNPEGLRTNLYLALNRYKQVDGYGHMFSNPIYSSKFEIIKNYRFCLCPENSLHPGYVTEKLFDAWYGGAIPIWNGPTNSVGGINQDAFLNYSRFERSDRLVERIIELDQSYEKYQALFAQPLLLNLPEIKPAIQFMQNALHSILSSRT